jgi:hypothetical protein
MVLWGGVATAAILLIVVIAAIHFWSKRSLPELAPGRLYNFAFWLSAISIIALAGYVLAIHWPGFGVA